MSEAVVSGMIIGDYFAESCTGTYADIETKLVDISLMHNKDIWIAFWQIQAQRMCLKSKIV